MKHYVDYYWTKLRAVDPFSALTVCLVAALVLLEPGNAMAQGFTFKKGLCNAVKLITSDAGKAIATAAIITVAIAALLGRVSWGQAVMIAAGIAGIFGAPTIAAYIATGVGDGGEFCGG